MCWIHVDNWVRLNVLNSPLVTWKACPLCVTLPLSHLSPSVWELRYTGYYNLLTMYTIPEVSTKLAFNSPMHFHRVNALFIYRVRLQSVGIVGIGILECPAESQWLWNCLWRHEPRYLSQWPGSEGAASVTSRRWGRGPELGLWLVESPNTRLWLAAASFLRWRRHRGIKLVSWLATTSVSQRLFRS